MLRVLLLSGCLLGAACGQALLNPALHDPARVPEPTRDAPLLKAHLKSGAVYLLRSWELTDSGTVLRGSGVRYDAYRAAVDSGQVAVPADSIALLETNTQGAAHPFGLQALAVMTTVWGSISVICVADPKSCFGSCPTFYLDDRPAVPAAEGFSASVARVLEARDVDALYDARPTGSRFALEMRNEALETHAVRTVRVLAVPRPPGGRVLATPDGRFFPVRELQAPDYCRASEGDCLAAVRGLDTLERTSTADSNDLAARETIELGFPATAAPHGIVIGARNTLLTTFLFYQTMAYMGRDVGTWLAALERSDSVAAGRALGMARLLGDIEVQVADANGAWRAVGTFHEVGPIATDVQVIPFEGMNPAAPLRVRLRLVKGNWRLGYVALARLEAPVAPRTLEPDRVERDSRPDSAALAALRDPNRYLFTHPGDRYRIEFALPPRPDTFELFLETQGYYYEWMRAEWLREEDPVMVGLILSDPAAALRRLAPLYKRHEPTMERVFWQSRFGR